MKNERYCDCGLHTTQCNCNRVAMDEIVNIIYEAVWSRNPPVIPGTDKDKLKKFVADYKEKQEMLKNESLEDKIKRLEDELSLLKSDIELLKECG